MRLFGKERVSEREAAARFVLEMIERVARHWPQILQEIRGTSEIDPECGGRFAEFEFALAVVATQIQAVRNLLEPQQAMRIYHYVTECVASPDLGAYPCEAMHEYQALWDRSISDGLMPLESVASALHDKLDLKATVEIGGCRHKDHLLVITLSNLILRLGEGWWKDAVHKYRLIP